MLVKRPILAGEDFVLVASSPPNGRHVLEKRRERLTSAEIVINIAVNAMMDQARQAA